MSGPAAQQPTETLTVLLVDDHQLLSDSLALGLAQQGISGVRADLTSAESVVAQAERLRPDLVLLDLGLGGAIGQGESLVTPLCGLGLRVLVVSATTDESRFGAALELGVVGVMPKSVGLAELVEVVVAAARGESVMSPERTEELRTVVRRTRAAEEQRRGPFERLSPREQQVLGRLVEGRSVSWIAESGYVSLATVRSQVRSILQKLEVGSQLEAVALAVRGRWY